MHKCVVGAHPTLDCGTIEIDYDPDAKPMTIKISKKGKVVVDLPLEEFMGYLVLAKAHFDLVK